MYGSHVTLLSATPATGFLSTSYDMYPPEFGAEHQILALDMNMDELNAWSVSAVGVWLSHRQRILPIGSDFAYQPLLERTIRTNYYHPPSTYYHRP